MSTGTGSHTFKPWRHPPPPSGARTLPVVTCPGLSLVDGHNISPLIGWRLTLPTLGQVLAKSEARRSHSAMIKLIKVEHDKIKAVLPSRESGNLCMMIWIAKNWLHKIAHFLTATIICDGWGSDIWNLVALRLKILIERVSMITSKWQKCLAKLWIKTN